MERKVTNIRDIARRLKVTPGTVSRALNHAPGVSEEMRENILQLADELDYRLKPFRSKRTNTIGLLLGTAHAGVIENEFLDIVVNEVTRSVSQRGLHLHLDFTDRSEEAEMPSMVAANRVDGVILAGYPSAKLCARLKEWKVPAVVLHDSAARTGLTTIQHNNFLAMKDLTEAFLNAGRRRIAFLMTDRKFSSIENRFRGFQAAYESCGVDFSESVCLEKLPDNLVGGREGVAWLFAAGPLPETVICINDNMAVGAMMEFYRCGVRIPDEVELAGCGNSRQSMETFPALTTIDIPLRETVNVALDQLQELIGAGGEYPPYPGEIIVNAEVIWRESNRPLVN